MYRPSVSLMSTALKITTQLEHWFLRSAYWAESAPDICLALLSWHGSLSLLVLLVSLAPLAMVDKWFRVSTGNKALSNTQDTAVNMLMSFHYRKRQLNGNVITSVINLRQWNVQGRGTLQDGAPRTHEIVGLSRRTMELKTHRKNKDCPLQRRGLSSWGSRLVYEFWTSSSQPQSLCPACLPVNHTCYSFKVSVASSNTKTWTN